MSAKQFYLRLVLMIALGVVASLTGAISAVPVGAGVIAFLVSIIFTAWSERVVRAKLFGKVGSGIISWYSMHLLYETIVYGVLLYLCHFMGVHVGHPVYFYIALAVGWIILSREAIFKIVSLGALYLAMRR